MQKKDVKVGEVYFKKVSGKQVKVRILRMHSYTSGGKKKTYWTAVNLRTQREVTVNSAAGLTEVPPVKPTTPIA